MITYEHCDDSHAYKDDLFSKISMELEQIKYCNYEGCNYRGPLPQTTRFCPNCGRPVGECGSGSPTYKGSKNRRFLIKKTESNSNSCIFSYILLNNKGERVDNKEYFSLERDTLDNALFVEKEKGCTILYFSPNGKLYPIGDFLISDLTDNKTQSRHWWYEAYMFRNIIVHRDRTVYTVYKIEDGVPQFVARFSKNLFKDKWKNYCLGYYPQLFGHLLNDGAFTFDINTGEEVKLPNWQVHFFIGEYNNKRIYFAYEDEDSDSAYIVDERGRKLIDELFYARCMPIMNGQGLFVIPDSRIDEKSTVVDLKSCGCFSFDYEDNVCFDSSGELLIDGVKYAIIENELCPIYKDRYAVNIGNKWLVKDLSSGIVIAESVLAEDEVYYTDFIKWFSKGVMLNSKFQFTSVETGQPINNMMYLQNEDAFGFRLSGYLAIELKNSINVYDFSGQLLGFVPKDEKFYKFSLSENGDLLVASSTQDGYQICHYTFNPIACEKLPIIESEMLSLNYISEYCITDFDSRKDSHGPIRVFDNNFNLITEGRNYTFVENDGLLIIDNRTIIDVNTGKVVVKTENSDQEIYILKG